MEALRLKSRSILVTLTIIAQQTHAILYNLDLQLLRISLPPRRQGQGPSVSKVLDQEWQNGACPTVGNALWEQGKLYSVALQTEEKDCPTSILSLIASMSFQQLPSFVFRKRLMTASRQVTVSTPSCY